MLSSAFADGPFPRGHSRSAMKLSQSFHVHGIAPSRNRTKAPRSPVPRQLLKHPPRRRPASADGPFPRRHTRITKSHPESSTGSAHAPASPCHASHGMRCRFHWRPFPASRIPAPTPKRRIRQFPANFSSTLPVAPLSRTAPLRADTRASPRAILNLPQARHMPPRHLVMPTAAGRRRFHWRPFPRVPHPRTYSKAPHSPAPRQLLKHPSRRPTFADSPSPHRHTRRAMGPH